MKETDNKPGARVAVDQLQSDQPGSIPQFSGKITSAYIWYDQLIVDRFCYLTYLHIMIITSQEETLAGKVAFEILAATFGVKINRYIADNGKISEQPSISEIDDSN